MAVSGADGRRPGPLPAAPDGREPAAPPPAQPIPIAHRPWPPPLHPWLLAMRWLDLAFFHWPLPPAALRPFLPPPLELDTWDGEAWLGVVPFRMQGVRPRGVPPLPWLSAFPELNVRTYVTAGGKPGVWFFSLDAANPAAVRTARLLAHLPYFDARMRCDRAGPAIRYASNRTHRGAQPAAFAARYGPTGPVYRSAAGTLEHWLSERYCLYSVDRWRQVWRLEIAHAPWPLQPAEAEIVGNSMTSQLHLALPDVKPLVQFARRQDVVAWAPERVRTPTGPRR